MSEKRAISRRTALAGLSAGGVGMAFASKADRSSAQEGSPESATEHAIVGTWVLQFEPAPQAPVAPAVAVFGADGSFIDAANGHAGVWEATGATTVHHTWVHVFAQANNYVVVNGTIELDSSGDSWTQPYSSMVVAADGSVLNTGGGNVHARRLQVVPEDEMGTPLEVVPTWTPAVATPT